MPIAIQIINYIGAFLISVAFLPQTYKLIKTKNTKGLSWISYVIYHLGLTFFIVYASFQENWALLAANAFGWIVNAILLGLIFYNIYKVKKLNKANNNENNNN
ncbi:Sugar transporter SemiSWEET [Spiroplasma sp. JKS002669]|uniref:SemiSWEET family sugar transporter n=1 Tax=Spiroplasma attinicola TaxID=2904537 RepID=UPI002023115B|nr:MULTISPECIES: PQ-loop domain-containing transporter [unclassified Spiroplasma]MCL6428637.1 Sugar transporter SemiSWEET [Spiroplasma sp. JKS002669]MCL8209979.1 Sugar transporter SemiSWEET [Spiroplasma sp. JKS002670]MCL8210932.1 Sugar transporter SemiSWEET [Spiroplasma sp. JKS002671]